MRRLVVLLVGLLTGCPALADTQTIGGAVKGAGAVVAESVAVRCVNSGNTAFESCAGAGGTGGTSSDFGAAFPSAGTAAGFTDGTNMRQSTVFDLDSGAGTQYVLGVTLRAAASGGSVALSTNTGVRDAGTLRVTVATDDLVPVSITGATFPDNEPFNVAQVGGVAVVAERCQREAKTFTAINQTTGTQLATGTAAERIFICSINLVTATAQNLALVSGTGTVCATGIAGIFGGTTAATGWNFAANGGLAHGDGSAAVGNTKADADNLCLLQSGAGQVSGGFSWVSN